jgi:hypothetical protein
MVTYTAAECYSTMHHTRLLNSKHKTQLFPMARPLAKPSAGNLADSRWLLIKQPHQLQPQLNWNLILNLNLTLNQSGDKTQRS